MSQNTPHHPEDEARGADGHADASGDHRDPLAGNPYLNQQRQAPQPDLDRGAPQLTSSDMRRMNRSALGLLAGIVLLLVVVAFWLFHSSDTGKSPVAKPREETVSVPDAPVTSLATAPATDPRAISLAPELPPQRDVPPLPPEPQQPATPAPHVPTLLERRIAAANGGTQAVADAPGGPYAAGLAAGMTMPGTAMPGEPGTPEQRALMSATNNIAYTAKDLPEVSTATPLQHPDTLMVRGTFIRCVLETRIITDMPGFTSCVVTEPIYSFTGKRMLLPKGSKVLGKYEMEPNGPRVAVIWDRIVTPTGIDVNMASPGIDTLGGAGHPGHYDAHWGSRIGSALLISLLSDAFKYEAAEHGPRQTQISNGVVTQSPFESNTADTVQQLANQAVRRAANRPATVTINQGTVLAIYVAKDVDFTGVVARY
ncbi:TrbI/VirB10 family protein [Luteibacter sp. 3190]|uniref:TrbI/VirB10 family protein n=1 Tax=Luteibacter sp. 3190 TaxID=2817736 RepID=UPI002863ADE1|nr:TrbI/VirB10 family protein [Luteibacter sp. 3190]MDR6935013.1 type IV secretion system protein VirB10 [Luteibacter sp. 3190]